MTVKPFILLPIFALGSVSNTSAANRDFTFMNDTGFDIDSVRVREHGESDWSEDLLTQDTLSNGATQFVRFGAGDICHWDLDIVVKGDSMYWSDINLCNITQMRISYDWERKAYQANYQFVR